MNEPIRYNATKVVGEYGSVAREQHRLHLAPDADCNWVKWDDYKQLKSICESMAKNVLRLGNECRALAEENTRLKAEMEALMTSPTSRLLRAERAKNALLKTEVESIRQVAQDNKTETEATRIENARLNNYIERLEVRNAELVPENARLKAEVSMLEGRLRYWKIEAECDHGRWLRCLEDLEHLRNLK